MRKTMTSERNVHKSRAVQVGILMRAYRESFASERGRRGLTQEELLRLMGSVDGDYAQRYSHATVSRWESGATRPTLQRLQVFGKALQLSTSEVAGLILLAGLALNFHAASEQVEAEVYYEIGDDQESVIVSADASSAEFQASGARAAAISVAQGAIRFGVFRCLTLGLCIVGVGYGLSLAGWNSNWMHFVYVIVITALVLAQGFFLPDRNNGLREFFWISIFFFLTTPFLQYAPLHLDHYNFSLITNMYTSHLPYMLGLLVNLALAGGAGLIYQILWKWQYASDMGASNPLRRAAWVVLPPVVIVYALVVVICNISVSIQLAFLMPVIAVVFTILLVLRDHQINLSERDRRSFLSSTVVIATVTSALGIIAIVAIYVSPDVPMALPNHNLLHSWEIDFTILGFSQTEVSERLNLGYMWHAMCVFAYLLVVVGSNIFVAIYRSGKKNAGNAAVYPAEAKAEGSTAGLLQRQR